MIDEFRRARRRKVSDTILVTDAMTDSVVGRIGNLSETGMLLMASAPLVEDALYQFRFRLHDARGREIADGSRRAPAVARSRQRARPGLDRLPLHHRSPATRPSSCASGSTRPAASTNSVRPARRSASRWMPVADPRGDPLSEDDELAPLALVQHALGSVQREALAVVHAERRAASRAGVAGHPFGDHVQAALVADLGDRVDDRAAHRVGVQVADEAAVDLDHVHRQVLQVAERRHAGAEVVQRDLAADARAGAR